ncbi:zf-BED domain-containing protein [Tanacetum coccineum]
MLTGKWTPINREIGRFNSLVNETRVMSGENDDDWMTRIEILYKTVAGQRKVKCKFCSCEFTGGIYRFKHHLARTHKDASACPMVPEDIKVTFQKLVEQMELAASKKRKLFSVDGDEELLESDDRPRHTDTFVSKKGKVQSTLNKIYKKDERDKVCQQIARFFYTSALSFNCVKNPEFKKMIQMVGDYGRGLDPPSYHEMRVTYLQKEVDYTKALLEDYKNEWKKTGCTLMSDGWSDRKNRSICNFLVNSPKGTIFLASIDTSEISKTKEKVFAMLDDFVEKIGEEHVVQVVTDNAANYKAAGEMLMNKRKKLFWTPCAAHCIDLMLEDFEKKIEEHKVTIAKGKKITSFIYNRTRLICLLREFTKGKELLRPGATRFATSYLTLGRLHEQKGALISMFASEKWTSSNFSKLEIRKNIESIVLDTSGFWGLVSTCLLAAIPLIKVLRMVDSDSTPAMGFIYQAMRKAKEKIKLNYKSVQSRYEPVINIVDERWDNQLNRPLHVAGYFLNPRMQYSSDFKARLNIHKKTLVDWWDSFGDDTPELKRFAMRVLSLTCSSSGCERNWSAFEMVHSKRRNCLHQQKMNDLVYVMYNLKLSGREEKKMKETAAAIDQLEALDFENVESDDEWITEEESTQSQAHDGGGDNVFLERALRSQFGRDDEFEEPDFDLHDANEDLTIPIRSYDLDLAETKTIPGGIAILTALSGTIGKSDDVTSLFPMD